MITSAHFANCGKAGLKASILLAPLLAATAAPAQKLPPANPLPLDETEPTAVLVPINAVLAAFRAGDATAVLAHVYPEGRVTAKGMRGAAASGIRSQSWAEFAQRITPEGAFDERISNPAIEIDGDVAMVWAPFTVRIAGKLQSCGYDLFDMVRENGAWKIANITFSSRTTGCPGA